MKDILIKNGRVLIYKQNEIELIKKDMLIKDGKIEKIENNIENKQYYTINANDKIIMPGLINTHTHLPMSIFRQSFEGLNLMDWLNNKILPKENLLAKQDIYYATILSCIEAIQSGTTCVNDQYFYPFEIRKAIKQCKIRAVLTRGLVDDNGDDKGRIDEFKRLYNKGDELITYSITPHGLYTCSPKYLHKVSELAIQYQLPVHIHYLENKEEFEKIFKLHNDKPVNILKKYFNKTHNILAHSVHLTDEDIEFIKTMKGGISHNPISNLKLGCGIADITKYYNEEINIGLGTDGQGSGNNLNLFEVMKITCLMQNAIHNDKQTINPDIIIKMATINGAKLLNLDNKVGGITQGKQADLIIINMSEQLNNISIVPNINILSNLINNISNNNIETTIVNGEILMENREIKYIDIEKIIYECNKIAERLGLSQ